MQNSILAQILALQLQPGDVVVVKKTSFRILDHYMVFVGHDRAGYPLFIANMENGVQWVNIQTLTRRAGEFEFKRVRPLKGNQLARQRAVRRAKSKLGQRYSLLGFNCEHFANYAQYGKASSQQVGIGLGLTAIVGGLFLGWALSGDEKK